MEVEDGEDVESRLIGVDGRNGTCVEKDLERGEI